MLCQKERHAYSVSFFLGFAGRGPAPPFGDSNARDGRAIPPPRFCLRQNARTPQKRRGPEGPLDKMSRWLIENLKYLDCSALPKRKDIRKDVLLFWVPPPKGGCTLRYFNAQGGEAAPPPRFCLRQNARTPQKRRGPEGPLSKISR